jgi:hypothetical protein
MDGSTHPRTTCRLASFAALLAAVATAEAQTASDLGSGATDLLRTAWPLLVIVGIPLLIVLVRNAARAATAREAERWQSLALALGGTLLMRDRRPTQPAGLRLEVGEWTAVVDGKTEGGEGGSSTFVRFRVLYTATRPLLLILLPRLGQLMDHLLHSSFSQKRLASVVAKRGVSLAVVEVGDWTFCTSDEPLAQELLADVTVRHLLESLQETSLTLAALPFASASDSAQLRLLTEMGRGVLPTSGGTWLLTLSIDAGKASPERLRAARDLLETVMSQLCELGVAAEGGSPPGVELKPE